MREVVDPNSVRVLHYIVVFAAHFVYWRCVGEQVFGPFLRLWGWVGAAGFYRGGEWRVVQEFGRFPSDAGRRDLLGKGPPPHATVPTVVRISTRRGCRRPPSRADATGLRLLAAARRDPTRRPPADQ